MAINQSGEPRRSPPAVIPRFLRPIQSFMRIEAAGGLILLAAAIVAMVWANSPWSDSYLDLLHARIVLDLGFYSIDEDLHFWINDVAMVLFFFMVGLEIKRELVAGELNTLRQAIVPVIGALGGMVGPVLVFFLLVGSGEARSGWGITMATDIAFAVGVLSLLGSRVPSSLKILLLAVAIFDDIGGVLVIAIFYTDEIVMTQLLLAIATIVAMVACNRASVRPLAVYVALGAIGWAATWESGVHPTIYGVAVGVVTPLSPWYDPRRVPDMVERLMRRYRYGLAVTAEERDPRDQGDNRREMGHERQVDALQRIRHVAWEAMSPLERIEHSIQPYVSFLIVPVFALANAGVQLSADTLLDTMTARLTLAVGLGLLIGKPLGITLAIWLASRLGGRMPDGVSLPQVFGMGIVAAIGFTVALFITELSYSEDALLADAKVGILAATIIAGIVGYGVLYVLGGRTPRVQSLDEG